MKKFIIILLISIFLIPAKLSAQDSYTTLQYAISFGTGDLADYVSKTSFRGFTFEYRKALENENIYAGFDLGWNTFYEKKDRDTYTLETMSLTGIQYRTSNHFPAIVSVDYFFRTGDGFNPYANFGVGTMYSDRRTDMGIYTLKQDAWHFAIKPEVGLIYNFRYNSAMKLAAKYYTAFKAGDLETQAYFTISGGFVFNF